ncbi:ABC transporter permease [Loigolactobacillus zhaoyuanensis]|uniref:ABC transporter permease n=1 Tax=Loigolactobacillus zhaoyuanensis TaxID=2486017 RepID=A0ABW8UCY3_9LACO|nr:ABC transporter permease [Loigolactobacillus zhaoyuanensis]
MIWTLVTGLDLLPEVLLPSLGKIGNTFVKLWHFGYGGVALYTHYLITMQRLLIAVLCAIVLGIPLGLMSGYVPLIKAIVDPLIQFIRPIPPLAYYTLLILWLGIGETSKITLLFLAALPPIYIACFDSVTRIDLEYLQSASSLGASRWQIFCNIVFPAAVPDIFTGLRSAVGVAYTTIVSAEMIAASSGIGWMIIDSSHYLKSDVMFIGIILLGVTGVLIDQLLKRLELHFVHWEGKK